MEVISNSIISNLPKELRGGGRNVEFHYYDWPFISEHRKCLLSSSLLRQKSDFRCSDFTYGVKKDHNVKNQNINYLWRITYGYQGLWGVRLGSIRLG